MNKKPGIGNNNWLRNTVTTAKLQIISEDNHWQTVGECTDTPSAILLELTEEKYKGKDIWIRDAFGDRKYHGHIN